MGTHAHLGKGTLCHVITGPQRAIPTGLEILRQRNYISSVVLLGEVDDGLSRVLQLLRSRFSFPTLMTPEPAFLSAVGVEGQ